MSEEKRYLRDDDAYKKKANAIISVLRTCDREHPIPRVKLAEAVDLTTGQLSSVIKYMRRCSETDLERYIAYYPISTKKGYFLPGDWHDFMAYYCTFFCWYTSIQRTIEPVRQKMIKEGIDYNALLRSNGIPADQYENYLDTIDEQNKDTVWFFEE